MSADHGKCAVGSEVGEQVVLLAHRAEVLPAQAKIQREIRSYAIVVLGEEAEAVVVGGAVGVAGGGQNKGVESSSSNPAGIEVHERVDTESSESASKVVARR